ncbi:MAG: PHP domain-containing protein, partial [Clostridia bacterium]|nr:PHP domain-containing protein [Clostridia bacterium]
MKKYLLPPGGQFYKANLHCHTTCSDGKLSPESVKEAYKAKGYSIVAYTDHFLLVPHNELTDDDFLALNAVELDNG